MRDRLSLEGYTRNPPVFGRLIVLGIALLCGCGDEQPVGETNGGSDQQAERGKVSNRADANSDAATRDDFNKESGSHSENSPQPAVDGTPSITSPGRTGEPRPIVRIDAQGRKWIGDIPYDVWFDDPLAVAGNTASVASGGAEPDPAEMNERDTDDDPTTAVDRGSVAVKLPEWQTIIPAAVLQAEVDAIRERLHRNLSSVRNYNRGYKDVRIDGATLAALSAIAVKHPDSVPWKQNAMLVRDLGTRIAENADGLGKKAFDATRDPYDRLAGSFDERQKQAAEEADAGLELSECADRSGLMQRIERAQQWLTQNVKGDAVSGKRAEIALHEATILETLARVIADASYVHADEEVYATQAAELAEAAHDVAQAVPSGQLEQATSALDRVQKTCNTCHKDYRF